MSVIVARALPTCIGKATGVRRSRRFSSRVKPFNLRPISISTRPSCRQFYCKRRAMRMAGQAPWRRFGDGMIRNAELGDIPALVAMEERSFDSDRLSRRNFRHLLTRGKAACLVEEEEIGRAAGRERGCQYGATAVGGVPIK